MSRMTLAEKVGQMMQISPIAGAFNFEDKEGTYSHRRMSYLQEWIMERGVGSMLQIGSDEIPQLQRMAESTRLGIPVLFAEDAIHGHCMHSGATIFPSQLSLSCSWNSDLFYDLARVAATEMVATGMLWTFSPVLCMGRDLRWGRIDETCGEDALLIGEFAVAMIKGYQGDSLSAPSSVMACAKHYAGYAMSEGGRDSYESRVGRRGLKSEFLPPFKKASDIGCATFMVGYQANDGIPCTADRWLLHDVLCEEWGFDGFLVTDWNNVDSLVKGQLVCEDLRQAAKVALNAGNHMIMTTDKFYEHALELVKDGEVDESVIDEACRRILLYKFKLGLFDEKRYPPENNKLIIGCADHVEKALSAARDSVVLLENKNSIVPLKNEVKKVALVGPNADDIRAQLGDWSFGSQQAEREASVHPRENIVTVFDALKQRSNIDVEYERGCDAIDYDDADIDAAVLVAKESDIVIACVGDNLSNHGEGSDRADLDLSGRQQELLEALKMTGKPLVVILITSKPLTIPWVKENADAVLTAFNPGMRGGQALVEALFGEINPCGKLTVSFPRHVGQMPVNYQQYPGWHTWGGKTGGYWDMPKEPLWSFGYGQSYTEFSYSNLVLSQKELSDDETLTVSVDVTNIGDLAGAEVIQLYVNDCVSSVTTPLKQLRAFCRVEINAGETKTVSMQVSMADLTIVLPDLSEIVEPGMFEIMVGASSRDEDLLKDKFRIIG